MTGKDIGHNLLTKCVTLCNHLMCKMEMVILGGLLDRLNQSRSLKIGLTFILQMDIECHLHARHYHREWGYSRE